MKVYVEILVLVAIFLFMFFWAVFLNLSRAINKWRYRNENDKSRGGEEIRRANLVGGKLVIEGTNINPSEPSKPEERGVIPSTNVDSIREDSFGLRKTRNPFRRR